MRTFILTCSSCVLLSLPALAQLNVTEIGGGPFANNFATLPSSSAFGRDEIAGGGIPIHKIPNIRDGLYGNSNSWIGDSLNSFVGISFVDALNPLPISIGQIAFGRDNNVTDGAIHDDRTAGTYTVQYTLAPQPSASTPDTEWFTIGNITQGSGDQGRVSASRRHAFSFAPVLATGLRLIAPGSSFADGAAIDELEVSSFAPAPFTLASTGGTANPATNLALAANGGVAFAKDALQGFAAHAIPHLNDGVYGNPNSWIGNSVDSFAGIRFLQPQTIDRIAFGRDNTGMFADRSEGYYLVQYTTAANPSEATADSSWVDIGPIFVDLADPSRALRHEYSFSPVAGATAVRILTAGDGVASGRAIDELEVYGTPVPEPGSAMLALIGLAALAVRRRA